MQHAHRELVVESVDSPADIAKAVADALANDGVLTLVDEKGRQVIIPAAKLAYVEIDEAQTRKVGFTAG